MNRFAIVAGLLALAACGSEESGTGETQDGTVETVVEGGGDDTTVTLSGEEGEVTITDSSGQKVALPAGFSIYPGATEVSSNSVTHADGSGVRLMFSTEASAVQVADFYRKQARAAGIVELTDVTAGGQIALAGKAEDGTDFSVTAIGGEQETTVNLMVSKGF